MLSYAVRPFDGACDGSHTIVNAFCRRPVLIDVVKQVIDLFASCVVNFLIRQRQTLS